MQHTATAAPGEPRDPHAVPALEVCRELGTDPQRGLDAAEARRRLAAEGANALPERPPPGALAVLARQFRNAMTLLLTCAAAVSVAVGEPIDAAVIAAIVLLNAVLGAVQEGRAEAAAQAVRGLLADSSTVIRDGRPRELDSTEIVRGDVVALAQGDRVPADGRLVEAVGAEMDESALTGESLPSAKRAEPPLEPDAPLAARATLAHAGSSVARGRARMVVTGTAGSTELARIAQLADRPSPMTPLQVRLERFAAALLRVGLALCVAIAGLAWAHGSEPSESILIGVSLAVAAVPEGLPAVITVTLALGMRRLAERGAIVRRLPAVEALGSVTVICTDKTGTLTENRMSLARLWASDGADDRLLRAALLASDLAGSPEDAAICAAAASRGLTREAALAGAAEVGGVPFDSERRLMSVVVARDGTQTSYAKGAPEAMLPRLAGAAPGLERRAAEWSGEGVRVLLVAERCGVGPADDPELGLEAVGLIGLADPARASAAPAVAAARAGGIRTLMITGDNSRTAAAIAQGCGIGDGRPRVVTGSELEELSDEQLRHVVGDVDVFARAVPAHKLRIVQALQSNGEAVAMTGDGVNDAPALTAADVGVAMGRGGSDAAIEAADIVLTDNDFATIVSAVEGGRTVYRNILRFIRFLLAANTGEVLVFAVAIALGLPAPLTILQILLVNLLTDGLPALALGLDPADRDVLRRPPRSPAESILRPIAGKVIAGGLLTGAAALSSFLIGWHEGEQTAQTMCFATLLFAQLAYVFAVRGERSFLRAGRNRALVAAVAVSAGVGAAVLALASPKLDVVQLALAMMLALVPFAVTEASKQYCRHRGGRRFGVGHGRPRR
jgi:Ca2+-transporting ATPase